MARTGWIAADAPEQRGRTAIVTGANSGIGFEAARELLRKGARVVLACRNAAKADASLRALREELPESRVEVRELDLARLASVRDFAQAMVAELSSLDLLVNNAGVMAIPRQLTEDGFEMQLGTNHLAHFALTGLLMPLLLATEGSRVVSVSSAAHRAGRIRFDDLHGERSYGNWRAYGQSKLANLLFTLELDRRLRGSGAKTLAAACHPGYAVTNLQQESARQSGSRTKSWAMRVGNRLMAQDARMGALPTLYATTAPGVEGGDFIGPDGLTGNRGFPTKVLPSTRARDVAAASRLFDVSESLTGVRFPVLS